MSGIRSAVKHNDEEGRGARWCLFQLTLEYADNPLSVSACRVVAHEVDISPAMLAIIILRECMSGEFPQWQSRKYEAQ